MNSLSTGIRESLALSTIERPFDSSHCQEQAIFPVTKRPLCCKVSYICCSVPLRIRVRPDELQRYSAYGIRLVIYAGTAANLCRVDSNPLAAQHEQPVVAVEKPKCFEV